ncbi:hypothetical protein GCM10027038_18910 [Arthrobacter bambusae]
MRGFTQDGLSLTRNRAKPKVSGDEILTKDDRYRTTPEKKTTRAINGAVHGHGVISMTDKAKLDKRKMHAALIDKSVSNSQPRSARGWAVTQYRTGVEAAVRTVPAMINNNL